MKKMTTTKEDAMATKKEHTCYPEDRREGQLDADCLRCQEIMANRIKREPKNAPTTKEDAMKTRKPKPAAQCPEWTWEDRCALPVGHSGAHQCAAALLRAAEIAKRPKTYTATYKGKPVRVTIPENEEG
jgi:hypothetical protein